TGAAGEELMQQLTGMQPLRAATGLRALHRSLELRQSRTLVMEGEAERIKHFFQVNLQGLGSSTVATLRPAAPKRPVLRSVPNNSADRRTRPASDARVSTLVSRLKAD